MWLSTRQYRMKRAAVLLIVAIGAVSAILAVAQIHSATAEPMVPSSIARIEVAALLGEYGYAFECSPVFISDNSVGLLVRSASPDAGDPIIVIVNWQNGSIEAHAEMQSADYVRALHAASGGQLLVEGRYQSFLYSSGLKDRQLLPFRTLVPPVPRSNTIGEQHSDNWTVYQLTPLALTKVREGQGELQSVSDDLVVFRRADTIITERLTGDPVGGFRVTPMTAHQRVAEIIGGRALYIDGTPNGKLVTFEGRLRTQIPLTSGWGFRHGQSRDGSRLLFDHFTRIIPPAQRVGESVIAALTLGLGRGNETANGEVITVVDTKDGARCFDLESPSRLFGMPGGWHADVSPSGRLVAVTTQTALSIYELPDACLNK